MIAPREFHLEYRRSAQRPYRPPQYERVMLPLTVLRRFDCVLLPTKAKVLAEYERWGSKLQGEALDAKLNKAAGQHLDRLLDFTGLVSRLHLPALASTSANQAGQGAIIDRTSVPGALA
jgi:hypothetical protein